MLMLFIVAVVVAFCAMQLSTFCTTIYLHRCMAHKGLKLHPAVAFLMQLELWICTGIVTREWVAVHRKHHHFTDEEGDPHSPYLKGLWKVLLLNAVYYARETNKPDVIEKYTKDIPSSPAEKVMGHGWWGLATGIALFVTGFTLLAHSWIGPVIGVTTFVVQGYGYIVLNSIINGAGHAIGYKNWPNTATNLRIVAWITAGEGLHNNHHQFPAASKLSMRRDRWEFDPAWPVIKVLTWIKLAEPLPLPKQAFAQAE